MLFPQTGIPSRSSESRGPIYPRLLRKVKEAMKAVNTTDVSAAEGTSTVTAVESDSGTGSDAE